MILDDTESYDFGRSFKMTSKNHQMNDNHMDGSVIPQRNEIKWQVVGNVLDGKFCGVFK